MSYNNQNEPKASHPIFVSVTEIELNAPQKMLEISCKLYTDDFEKTLRMHTKEKVDLLNPVLKKQMDLLVNNYIQQHLILQADGKKLALQYLGFEQQEEGIVSFFQAANINSLKKLDITNNLLYEYKTEQLGIIHVLVNGNRKSTKLNNPEAQASFSF
jgi:hypothetical protein